MAASTASATVSPPSGLGSVPGLGEALRMNLNTGQGVYSYRLALPDGVAGHTPNLSLEYSHGTRMGPFGFGWRLDVRAINRRLDLGGPGQATETFLDGTNEITALEDGTYGALTEMLFSRYSREGDGWKIEERNGDVYELGTTPAARIADPDHPDRVQSWLLERWTDVSGNAITCSWDTAEGMPYLTEMRYAAYSVRFRYEPRPDVRRDGRAGFIRTLGKRCTGIELVLDPGPGETKVRSWTLTYDTSTTSGVSLLSSIQLRSFASAGIEGGDVVRPPVRFSYGAFDVHDVAVQYYAADGDGPPPLTDAEVALVTLDQAPLPGILQVTGGKQVYWRNTGAGWEDPLSLPDTPFSGTLQSAGAAFIDVNGSGKPDLVLRAPGSTPGYFENDGLHGWGAFVAYPRNSRVTPDWTSQRLRFADNDTDGRVDAIESLGRGFALWRNRGEQGWSEPFLVPAPADGAVDFSDPLVVLADMTGDGSSDIVEIASGAIRYWPNLGDGRFAGAMSMAGSPRLPDLHDKADRVFLMDVDGDGCADLVYAGDDSVLVAINRNGASFGPPALIEPVPPPIPGTVRPVNLKGTATAGLTWNSYQSGARIGYVQLEFNSATAPYLLSRVENGSGLVSEIFYRSAVDEYVRDRAQGTIWDTNFPFPLRVVGRTRETDQVTGMVTEVLYQYHDAHYEPHLRRFEGFRTAERIEKGDESRADTRLVHQFLMAMERVPGNTIDHAALNGCLARIETFSLDGTAPQDLPVATEESDYQLDVLADTVDGRHRSFVAVKTHRTLDHERSADVRGEEHAYTYNATGSVVRDVHRGFGTKAGVAQPEQVKTTEVTYATSATHRLLNKQASVVVRDGAGHIIAETQTFYDGPDFTGLPLGQADRGLMTRRLRLAWSQADFEAHYDASMDGATALGFVAGDDADGQAAQFVAEERHAYDARGLTVADCDPMGAVTRFTFDADALFRTQLDGPLGSTSFVNNRVVGQPSQITYANGEVVHFAYDAQGRLKWTLTPVDDPAQPPRIYSYDDSVIPNVRTILMLQTRPGNVRSPVLTYFDGHGNEIQQRVQVDATTYVVSGVRTFNPWGDVKQEFEPHFSPGTAFSLALAPPASGPSRTIRYDARGRVTETVNFNGGVSTARYFPFRVELADANDNDTSPDNVARGQANTPRREEFDVLRQRIAVVEMLGGGREMTVSYVNDAMGRTVEIHDASGLLCSYRCDLLGNRYQADHRAAGQRRLWYDARNRVVRSVDANGNDLRVTMDGVGRLQRLTTHGEVLEEYTYDTGGAETPGQVASIVYRGGSQSYKYNAAGQLTQAEFHFDGVPTTHQINYEYDPLGRETARVHSDGMRIEKRLTFNGWISAIPNVLTSVTYNPRGLPETITYANGVTTTFGYLEGPGRVSSQRTTGPHGDLYEDITCDFDRLGLLLKSSDAAPAGRGTVTYSYDPLYQVTSASRGGPPNPTLWNYGYSNFLNLASMGETNSVFAFDDAAHPDRIAGMTAGGGPRQSLTYDANGNLLGFGDKTFTFNDKSELVRVSRTDGLVAEYAYDPKGDRVSKKVTDRNGVVTTTLFVGAEVEIRAGRTFHYVLLNERRVGLLSDGAPRFIHTDYAGNTSFFSDAIGAKIAAITYRPFGNVDASNGAVDTRTYGLHPFDTESGLYYMRRRFYAPELGRFLTPDPMPLYKPHKVLGRPKAFHPYAYAGSDPLNNIDYEGLSFWSVVGAIVGVIAAIAVVAVFIALTAVTGGLAAFGLAALLAIGIVGVSYYAASKNEGNGWGEFFRGFMIGFNAGLNAAIATALFGPVIGVTLGVINFLAAIDTVAGNKVYQGILGWSSWLMPMSWAVTAVGLVIFLINVIAAGVSWNGSWYGKGAHIDSLSIDWGTGTIVMTGGWISAPSWASGFNMGNFAYVNKGAKAEEHETGHTLGVAAFGSIAFGAISGIEDAITHTSYSEHLAESHDPTPANPQAGTWWHMWDA